jgi:hypothetical protein
MNTYHCFVLNDRSCGIKLLMMINIGFYQMTTTEKMVNYFYQMNLFSFTLMLTLPGIDCKQIVSTFRPLIPFVILRACFLCGQEKFLFFHEMCDGVQCVRYCINASLI